MLKCLPWNVVVASCISFCTANKGVINSINTWVFEWKLQTIWMSEFKAYKWSYYDHRIKKTEKDAWIIIIGLKLSCLEIYTIKCLNNCIVCLMTVKQFYHQIGQHHEGLFSYRWKAFKVIFHLVNLILHYKRSNLIWL